MSGSIDELIAYQTTMPEQIAQALFIN